MTEAIQQIQPKPQRRGANALCLAKLDHVNLCWLVVGHIACFHSLHSMRHTLTGIRSPSAVAWPAPQVYRCACMRGFTTWARQIMLAETERLTLKNVW